MFVFEEIKVATAPLDDDATLPVGNTGLVRAVS